MNTIQKKRQKFHSEIRQKYIEEYMKKIRYELLQNQQYNTINQLIEQTLDSIDEKQLQSLIDWANSIDENNAIIHLGNLLIDKIVDAKILCEKFQLRPKDSEYWLWLIKILVNLSLEHEYSFSTSNDTQKNHSLQKLQFHISYVLNKILTPISSFAVIQCLEIFKLLLEKLLEKFLSLIFKQNQSVLRKITQYCLHSDKKVSELSYDIIDIITQAGQNQTIQLLNICPLNEIQHVLLLGLSKIDHSQKKFPLIVLRIINNIFSSKVLMGESILKGCINLTFLQKNTEKVRVQLSYLWLSFTEIAANEMLQRAFDMKILNAFEHLLISEYKKESNLQKVRKNLSKSLKIILEKLIYFEKRVSVLIKTSVEIMANRYILNEQSIQDKYSSNQKSNNFEYVLNYQSDLYEDESSENVKIKTTIINENEQLMDLEN